MTVKRLFTVVTLMLMSVQLFGLTGRQIAEKVKEENDGKSSWMKGTMTVYNSGGGISSRRTLVLLGKETGSRDYSIVKFMKGDNRGTTFLTHEPKSGDSLSWIYLANSRKTTKVDSSNEQDNFVDTDFTYEALRGFDLDDYNYKNLGTVTIGGQKHYRLKGTRKQGNTTYDSYLAIVNAKTWVVVRMNLYKNGSITKTMRASSIRPVQGNKTYYIPHRVEVRTVNKNTKTVLNINSVKVDIGGIGNYIFMYNRMRYPLPGQFQ